MMPKLPGSLPEIDHTQAALHGGDYCFHIDDGRFCGRAERWAGHEHFHSFVSFEQFLRDSQIKYGCAVAEACAIVCDDVWVQRLGLESETAHECAAAIREAAKEIGATEAKP